MTGRRTRNDIEGRIDEVRRLLRERHAGITPDASFAARVVANLPRNEAWAFDWAARRILPVSIGLALVLTLVVVITGGSSSRTTVSTTATATTAPTSQSGNDPLEWLLESRQELR